MPTNSEGEVSRRESNSLPYVTKRDTNDWRGERGAWIGTQLGCTGWLAIAASLAAREGSMAALAVFALFAVANGVGFLLWILRHRLRLWNALMLLVLVCGVTSGAAVYALDEAGLWEAIQMEPWVYSAETGYGTIAAVHLAGLFVLFMQSRIKTNVGTES